MLYLIQQNGNQKGKNMYISKHDMARLITQSICILDDLPAVDHPEVKRIAKRPRCELKPLYKAAIIKIDRKTK